MLEEIEHDALETFLVDLMGHPDPFIRKDVLQRIGRLKLAGTIGVVKSRVDTEQDTEVRGAAIRTLCELGETDVFDTVLPFLDDADKVAFLPLIDNIGPVERLKALECLGVQKIFGKHERLRQIIWLPMDKCSAWLKSCALYLIGQAGAKDDVDVATGALLDDHPMIRETAVWALGRIKPADLAARIGGCVDDTSGPVARMAGEILRHAGTEHAG